jgi:hypothetical protein
VSVTEYVTRTVSLILFRAVKAELEGVKVLHTVLANLTEAGMNVASSVSNFTLHTLPFPVREYKLEFD